jgi:hypothetical protein
VLASIRARALAAAFVAGVFALAWVSLAAFGGFGHLFQYSAHPVHKFTARAMMHGALNLRRQIMGVGHDEQVYNGAGFTNWGFGVPLLQIPFHAVVPLLRRWIKAAYFPDRLIFFTYLVALLPLLWMGVHRMLFHDGRRTSRQAGAWIASWCVTLLVLAYSLFELISFRFIVYEETIAYFVVFQLLAIALYARFIESKDARWAAALGVAASIALLVRPTGLPYLAMWGALVALHAWRRRPVVAFVGAALPGVSFWCFSNWIRSGAIFSLGYQNANPAYPIHYQMVRFGSRCASTGPRLLEVCRELFESLFVALPSPSPLLADCGLMFESRLPGEQPYLPSALLLVFAISVFWCLMRAESRVAYYVPHAMLVALFCAYVHAAAGLAWRYAGDFWPVFVLIGLQELRRLKIEKAETLYGLAIACVFAASFQMIDVVFPALHTLEVTGQSGMIALETEHAFEQSLPQPPLPTRIACGDPLPSWARGDGVGWAGNCAVAVASNVYLGVKPNKNSRYKLRFEVDHPTDPTLNVFVNGRNYVAHLRGADYEADVAIDGRRLRSPVVMASVEWSPAGALSPEHLRWIELEI